jgi:hypothetical protein
VALGAYRYTGNERFINSVNSEVAMYIDGVVLGGIVTVLATCAVVVYLAIYSCKKIKEAEQVAAREQGQN